MPGSYREIDYRLRPAKHAERLMMCDVFRRLRFETVESYQYVGLGSVYFSDFAIFHKALGLDRMISIEDATDVQTRNRFLDNRPFSNIEMKWGRTTTKLPEIDLSPRSIIWLDYDGRLSREILDDVRTVVSRCSSGTVLCVSVQCRPEAGAKPGAAIEDLAIKLGRERIGVDLEDRHLLGWGTAKIFRRVIVNEIAAILAQRNATKPQMQQFIFEQILNFHYQDGAQMMTVGGVLLERGQRPLFDLCAFSNLSFVRTGEDAFRIDIPKLTFRELRQLEAQMPLAQGAAADVGNMPQRDAGWYMKIYRYFPNFMPVEV